MAPGPRPERDTSPAEAGPVGWAGLPARARFSLRFADGGCLPLGARTAVMGVLNVTPDSFSDGGWHATVDAAVAAATAMALAGAALVDVGGESTRPGADPVAEEEELRRVVPVVRAIKRELDVRVSVDTTKAAVAREAIDAGADLVNDVSALGDPALADLLAARATPVVLMHRRGTPRTMQHDTRYPDVVEAIREALGERVQRARAAGIDNDRILIDPGIGFGKSAEGNLEILGRLPELLCLGHPLLIGASRKAFIGAVLDLPVEERLEGSLAVAALVAALGAHVIRAHDVAATVRAVRMIDAIRDRRDGPP